MKIDRFCENLTFFDHCDLKFDLIKNNPSIFCRTRRGLSNAVYRLSLFLSFRVFWRAVIRPPPPGRVKVAQTPGRARVKNIKRQRELKFRLEPKWTFWLNNTRNRAISISIETNILHMRRRQTYLNLYNSTNRRESYVTGMLCNNSYKHTYLWTTVHTSYEHFSVIDQGQNLRCSSDGSSKSRWFCYSRSA